MKRFTTTIVALLAVAITTQAQDLPKPSPSAKTEQRVGLTDISIEYSRPGVKERTIWGDLVPYGEVWRAGANKATKFSTSYGILIGGKELPKGDYSLFIIPMENGPWTVIFNKETELWGSGDYKESEDQLRITANPEKINCASERIEYHFIDVSMDDAKLAIDWAGIRLSLDIKADPASQVKANIDQAIKDAKEDELWRVYRNAASYAKDVAMTKEGLEWIAKSVELQENWYSYWVYGNLLAQNKDKKGAIEKAKKAIEIGNAEAKESGKPFPYTDRIQADIDAWKK